MSGRGFGGRGMGGSVSALAGLGTPAVGDTLVGATGGQGAWGRSPAQEQTNAQTQRFIGKLQRGAEDVSLLVVGDSTGWTTVRWVYLAAVDLAARFPAYTVIYHLWDPTGQAAYDAGTSATPVTLHTGTGSQTLHIWNCSVSGTTTYYTMAARWPLAIVATNPDLVLISHGKNEGTTAAGYGEGQWRGRYIALADSISDQFPLAGICVILQCPNTDSSDMALKARVYEEIASARGFGCIDVHQAFVDTGNVAAYMLDTLHPTSSGATNGSRLWADTVLRAFQNVHAHGATGTRETSSLTVPDQLLINGSFADFTGTVPAGWALSFCTATKDTRAGWFERNDYGVRLQATGASASSLLQTYPDYALLKGKYVTLFARVKIATGQTTSAGRVSIYDGVNTTTSIGPVEARDGFLWIAVTHKVSASATLLQAGLLCDTAGTPAADVTFDCAYMVPGIEPRIARYAPGSIIATRRAIANTADVPAFVASNPTPALVGAQVQYTPSYDCVGSAWDGTISRTIRFGHFGLPVVGSGTISGVWTLHCSIDGAAATTIFSVSSAGTGTFPGSLSVAGGAGITATLGAITATRAVAASTVEDALIVANTGSATSGNQRYSRAIKFTGAGFNVTAAASQVVDAHEYLLPVQQASGVPASELVTEAQSNAGGFAVIFSRLSQGGWKIPTRSTQPTTPAAGFVVYWHDSGTNKLMFVGSDGVAHPVTST